MMKIEKVVGDLILLVLDNHEPLKKIGIDQDKIFVKVKGYDENGMWIHHPGFQVPNLDNGNKQNDYFVPSIHGEKKLKPKDVVNFYNTK